PTVRGTPRRSNDRVNVSMYGEEMEVFDVFFDEETLEWSLFGERVLGASEGNAPTFFVPSRKRLDIPLFPCMDCHKKKDTNYNQRKLKEKHAEIELDHGKKLFWCTNCHYGDNMNLLVTMDNRPLDIDLAYLLCGQCHSTKLRDWEYGIHGKRIGMWSGERVFTNCTVCHKPHSPRIKSFVPVAPPVVRTGLKRPDLKPMPTRLPWQGGH
ncbi:MAG: hypothetical protein OEZ59_03435, partial [Deltaproteobacteria bacterium]|nr:hypothetical protein [Deltaproteobacteria bacterium]